MGFRDQEEGDHKHDYGVRGVEGKLKVLIANFCFLKFKLISLRAADNHLRAEPGVPERLFFKLSTKST